MNAQDAPEDRPRSGPSAWLRRAVYLIVTAVLVYFVGKALLSRLGSLSVEELRPSAVFLVPSVACFFARRLLSGFVLHATLGSFGHRLDWREPVVANAIAGLGKYVPGKVASLAGNAVLLGRFGVPAPVAVSAAAFPNLLTVLAGLIVAAPVLLSRTLPFETHLNWTLCLLVIAVGLVCLHPKVFVRLSNVVLSRLGREPIRARLDYRRLGRALALIAVRFCVLGLGVWLAARSVGPVPAGRIPLFVSISVAASVIGFLAFFTPAGLGVREGIYLLALAPLVGEGAAALVTVMVRLIEVSVDVIVGLGGLAYLRTALGRRAKRRAGEAGTEPADE